jgi:polyphosphate kinase
MHRNLDRRVEVLVRVPEAEHVTSLGGLLALMADDDTTSWHLQPDAQWHLHPGEVDVQSELISRARRRRSR